jgi:hypothetical protein
MANKLLNGTNWDTSGDWSPATEPVTADDVRVADAPRDIITGDQGTIDLNSLLVPNRYVGAFGTTGAPLKIACTKVVYKGRGGFYYESDANGGSAFRTDEILIDAADPAVKVEIGSNGADPGKVDRVTLMRGNVLLKGNIVFDASLSLVDLMREATLTIAAGASVALPLLHNQGGISKSSSGITTLRQTGGEHTQDTVKITRADVFSGTLIYSHAAISGDATLITVWDGATLVLDADSFAKTITTIYLYPGARMSPSKLDGINLIVTNLFDLRR